MKPDGLQNFGKEIKADSTMEPLHLSIEPTAIPPIKSEIDNDSKYIKIEDTEDVDIQLESLHHSIDIKDDTSMGTFQLDQDCELQLPTPGVHPKILTGKNSFQCNFCDYKSNTKAQLVRHLRIHTGEKPFACTICDYKSSEKRSVQRHLLIHTGEKSFECKFCDYKTSRNQAFRIHLQIHAIDKPYKCTVCDYGFIHKKSLQKHLLTHTSDKPAECTFCDYNCSQGQNLGCSSQTHTFEKPFECSTSCKKEYLANHVRTYTVRNKTKKLVE